MPDFFLPTPSPCRLSQAIPPGHPGPHRRVKRLAPCRTSPPNVILAREAVRGGRGVDWRCGCLAASIGHARQAGGVRFGRNSANTIKSRVDQVSISLITQTQSRVGAPRETATVHSAAVCSAAPRARSHRASRADTSRCLCYSLYPLLLWLHQLAGRSRRACPQLPSLSCALHPTLWLRATSTQHRCNS